MKKTGQIILAINYFSLGILAPVLNLLFLSKGATLQTLPLFLAVYSCTVFLFELPSGICADVYGRKAVFLLSCVFKFCSLLPIIFWANGFVVLFTAIMSGLGRAFSSGSLDALLVDKAIAENGEDALPKITSSLAVMEGAGLSLGGIVGGFLAAVGRDYIFNILLRVTLSLLAFFLCYFFVKEYKKDITNAEEEIEHVDTDWKEILTFGKKIIEHKMSSHKILLLSIIVAGMLFTGIAISITETYWQSAFTEMNSGNGNTWMLGFISSSGFAATVFGNIIIGKILEKTKNRWWKLFFSFRLLFTAILLLLAVQTNRFGFIFIYTFLYLTLGISNVIENTIINQLIPSNIRASFLSLSSLVLQIGSFFAYIISGLCVLKLHFGGLWVLAGLLMGGYTVIGICFSIVRR